MSQLPLRLGVVDDFRNPPDSGISTERLYAEILDQVAWLDTLGLELVWFTGHHFTDLVTWTVPPGLRPEQMNRSLERFAREVAPRLRLSRES